MGILDQPRGMDNPLFHMGMGLLSRSGTKGQLGQGLAAGLQNYQTALTAKEEREAQRLRNEQVKAELEAAEEKRKREADFRQKWQGLLGPQEVPFEQDLFPGEQEITGLKTVTPGVLAQEKDPLKRMAMERMLVDPASGTAMLNALKTAASTGDPAAVREWEYFSKLPEDQQEAYIRMKRQDKFLDLGPQFIDPRTGRTYGKGLDPEKELDYLGEAETAKGEAQTAVQLKRDMPLARATVVETQATNQFMSDMIDQAVALIGPGSAGYAGLIKDLPETQSKELKALLDTIKANVGFQTLNKMRQLSKTGGALGNVTERELEFLQATLGSLDQQRRGDKLFDTLKRMQRELQSASERMSDAYSTQYSNIEGYGLPTTGTAPPPVGASTDDLTNYYLKQGQ